jgi:hypothetical protein
MLKNAGRSVMAAKACQLTTKPTRKWQEPLKRRALVSAMLT